MKCYGNVLRHLCRWYKIQCDTNPKVTLTSSTKRHTLCLAIYEWSFRRMVE
jgi:hypothetical protein